MYQNIKKNWDKTKFVILFFLTATLLLLLTVVYKSDEKITSVSPSTTMTCSNQNILPKKVVTYLSDDKNPLGILSLLQSPWTVPK